MVEGLGASVLWVAGATVVGQISPDAEQGRWLGSYNQVAAFSSMAGDLVGGYLLYAYGFTTPYLVLAAVTLGSFVLVWIALRDNPGGRKDPEEASRLETFRSLFGLPMLRALVGFRFAFSFGKMAVIIFLPIYARTEFGLSAFAIGWIMAGGKLTKALTQGYVGTFSDRVGRLPWFIISGAYLFGLGVMLIPGAQLVSMAVPPVRITVFESAVVVQSAFFALSFAYLVMSFADSVRVPASNTLCVNEGDRVGSMAASLSLRSFPGHISSIFGPVVIGSLVDLLSYSAAFSVAALIAMLSGTIVAGHQLRLHSVPAFLKPLVKY
jgi:MFS family permease